VQLVGDRWRDERPNRSPLHRIAFWGGIVGDVAKTALTEHTEGSMVSFKKNWWMWLAGLLGTWQLVMAVGLTIDPDSKGGDRILGLAFGAVAIAIFIGLRLIAQRPSLGGGLIAVGAIPSAATGVIFFWFPPMWLVTVAAVVVIVHAAEEVVSPRRDRPSVAAEAV